MIKWNPAFFFFKNFYQLWNSFFCNCCGRKREGKRRKRRGEIKIWSIDTPTTTTTTTTTTNQNIVLSSREYWALKKRERERSKRGGRKEEEERKGEKGNEKKERRRKKERRGKGREGEGQTRNNPLINRRVIA